MSTIRLIFFSTLCIIAPFLPVSFFIGAIILYLAFWRGTELLIISFYIDAQFGYAGVGTQALYSSIVSIFLLTALLIKPYIRFYNF